MAICSIFDDTVTAEVSDDDSRALVVSTQALESLSKPRPTNSTHGRYGNYGEQFCAPASISLTVKDHRGGCISFPPVPRIVDEVGRM